MSAEPWSHDYTFPALPPSAGAARAFVAAQLRCHGLTDQMRTIEMVTSELVTNAIRHAQTRFTVTIRGEMHEVRVIVRDGDPHTGTSTPALLMSLGGRGLLIADALSDAWGIEHEPGGKSVWATFTLATAPRERLSA